jgi:hypothetical protein
MHVKVTPDNAFALISKSDLDLWATDLDFCVRHITPIIVNICTKYFVILQRISKIHTGQIRTHIQWKMRKKWRLSQALRKRARQKSVTPRSGQFWPQGYNLINLGIGPLHIVLFQISHLCQFREEIFIKETLWPRACVNFDTRDKIWTTLAEDL